MRILFLSNYYPPFSVGGYDQLCEETATELAYRGHQLRVLTSVGSNSIRHVVEDGVEVRRQLRLELEGGGGHTIMRLLANRRKLEHGNLESIREAVTEFRPDAALIWAMWNVPRSVPAMVEELMPGHVAYYLCDYWPSLPSAYIQRWREPARRRVTILPKKLLGWFFLRSLTRERIVPLRLERPLCVSHAVRGLLVRSGVPIDHAQIVHNGIEIDDFPPVRLSRRHVTKTGLRLLYAGRLAPDKGVHTAVRAMAFLESRVDGPVTLDMVGAGDADYVRSLKDLIGKLRLHANVSFRDSVPRARVPTLLAEYDVLIFPSEYQEPLARIVMEAMATGLVVVGTTTGGTGELLKEDVTGLTFRPGDARGLASQIGRLLGDSALAQRLAQAARARVEQEFTFQRMVDELETVLREL